MYAWVGWARGVRRQLRCALHNSSLFAYVTLLAEARQLLKASLHGRNDVFRVCG